MLILKTDNSKRPVKRGRWLTAVAVSVLLTACGGGGSGDSGSGNMGTGGIIGTGIRLEGTASSQRLFASNQIEVKSASGETTMVPIGNRGRFQANEVKGEGPFLMRASMGNDEYLYGIGHAADDGSLIQNVHSYSDAAARNWFARNGIDIDGAFIGNAAIDGLPDQTSLRQISQSIQAIIGTVLTEYEVPNVDLDTVDFDSDDTGVDRFLDSNPVIINNGTITIIVQDPDTDVVTQSSTEVALNTDLAAEDTQPPSAPGSVRAIAASMNDIVVVWDAAVDNIGVSAYEIYRDGTLVATTPFPVYTDEGLLPNTQYMYTVVAIDSSGLRSADSLLVTSETLALPDDVAPPAPTSVVLEPSTNSLSVRWLQTDISDVASFNVIRSGAVAGAATQFKATSTFLTDATVLAGSEYCYQVSAEDASGNISGLSAVQCASTLGTATTPVTSTPTPTNPDPVVVVPPVATGELLAPTVDVSSVACTEEVPNNGTISADTVLAAGCYLAPNGIRVNEPANLTVQPGAVIKFSSAKELFVGSGASMTAVGTSAAPIVFSSIDPTPGFWNGVRFQYSNSSRNQLDFVQIEYAGASNTEAALKSTTLSTFPTRVSVKNTTTRFSAGYGMWFDQYTILSAFEGNLMVNNNAPLLITPEAANGIDAGSRYSGNTNDIVRLSVTGVSMPTRLAKLDVPYISGRMNVDSILTVEPGVTIIFEASSQILINDEGALKAVGTVAEPILFTASDPTPGFWTGVVFNYSSGGSDLQHVTIEYGGSASDGANLTMKSFVSIPSRLSANNVTLRHSLNDGFVIENGSALAKFEQIISTQNGRSGNVAVDMIDKIGAGSSFIGNDEDVLVVDGRTIDQDATWLTHDVPYSVERLNITAGLNLSPGTTVIVDAGGQIQINDDGYLSAIGTAADNIVFTGKSAIPGYWEGIEFRYAGSTANRLSYAVVEYGGSDGSNTAEIGNITMTCFDSIRSRVALDNVMLNFSAGWGLYAQEEGCEVTLGMNVTYTSNMVGTINIQ